MRFLVTIIMALTLTLTVPAKADSQGYGVSPGGSAGKRDALLRLNDRQLPQKPSQTKFLIDIPGVGWKGGARENDWGNMLSPNKTTIYVRHQGPGVDKWDPPKEPNVIVVTSPHKWDEKVANERLLPHLNSTFSQGKDVYVVVDKNITFWRHVLPLPKSGEDKWAANATDYISKHKPSDYSGILAEHSRGTVTNRYIKDFSPFKRIIIASPRGDDALSWIHRTPNLPKTDIITGLSDAPNFRWKERYGTLLRENPNVSIIQLQDIADPLTTHSRLQNLGTTGNWKIIIGAGSQGFKGSLRDSLTIPRFSENTAKPIIGLDMGHRLTAVGNSAHFNQLDLPTTSELKQWSRDLRESGNRDLINWAVKAPISAVLPSSVRNIEKVYNITRSVMAGPGKSPTETLDRLKPVAALGGPMSGLLVPFLKGYYGMVFKTLGSIDVRSPMASLDQRYQLPISGIKPLPAQISGFGVVGNLGINNFNGFGSPLMGKGFNNLGIGSHGFSPTLSSTPNRGSLGSPGIGGRSSFGSGF